MRRRDMILPMPLRGVDETRAFSDQRADTTYDAENVRSVGGDRRVRITQREGMAKHYAYAMPGPVRVVASIVYENKTVVYEATEDEIESNGDGREKHSLVWQKATTAKKDARNVVTDSSGNVYVLTGNVIEKRSSSGAVEWTFALKLASKSFRLAPMVIGSDNAIMVGVEGGGSGATGAAIYRVRQKAIETSLETEPVLEWEYRTDAWVRELKVSGGKLKALLQFDEGYRSYVRTLIALNNADPLVEGEYQVPYPSTCMDLAPDGSSYTGHPEFTDRDTSPSKPGVGISLESWTPTDLLDYEKRIWAWHRSEDLAEIYGNGDEVVSWPDRLGAGRPYLKGATYEGEPAPAPTLDYNGTLEVPTLRFNGSQGLFSLAGGGRFNERESCKTTVPNHGDAAFCTFVVCRPYTASTPGFEETDDGQPLDARRFIFQQMHHRKYGGASTFSFDVANTGAYRSGLLVNSGDDIATTDNALFCWGKHKSLKGSHEPGVARAYTSSSGYLTGSADADGYDAGAWTAGTSIFDYPGMPLQRGAGKFGWPKPGTFSDASSLTEEGWCVITFLHCGGLNEFYAAAGSYVDQAYTLNEQPDWISAYPTGSNGIVYIGGTGYPFTKVNNTTLSMSSSPGGSGSAPDGKVVWARNLQTRSTFRINGYPVDRWEALPVGYTGPSTMSSPSPGDLTINLNVEASPTGLGLPEFHDYIKGFFGEIAEIVTLGNRTGLETVETLGGDRHFPAPSVLAHPKYAANAHTNDSTDPDLPYANTPANGLSTEMEKIEGYLMARYGVSARLQDATADYPHPHFPAIVSQVSHDLPLADDFADSGQAWVARLRKPEAMIVKHDESGRMLWCLLAANVYGAGTGGDIVYQDLNGLTGVTGVTDAQPTCGVAAGLDGDLFFVGVGDSATGTRFCLGRIDDDPTTTENPQIQSVGWYTSGAPFPDDIYKLGLTADVTIRCRTDSFGNFHIPIPPDATYLGSPAQDAVRSFSREGDLLFRLTTLNHGANSFQNGYAVAFPPTPPTYNVNE